MHYRTLDAIAAAADAPAMLDKRRTRHLRAPDLDTYTPRHGGAR